MIIIFFFAGLNQSCGFGMNDPDPMPPNFNLMSRHNLYSNLLYEIGQDFLDTIERYCNGQKFLKNFETGS